MARDYYAEAREIARRLDKEGHAKEARSLIDVIDTATTGTEILMALKWNLQRLETANLAIGFETRARIRDLYATISLVLGK